MKKKTKKHVVTKSKSESDKKKRQMNENKLNNKNMMRRGIKDNKEEQKQR